MEANEVDVPPALISIITVTFNAAKHIQRCIDSVKSQSYKNIEHIIIDGDSTDGTIGILEKNTELLACWISEPDKGIYNAMNKGLKYAKGEWLYFLGADDFLFPEFSQMALLLNARNTIYYGQCLWGDTILGRKFSAYRLTIEGICHHSILYPKKVFKKYTYSEKYVVNGDHLLNLQCWNDREFKKIYIPILIANFSQGGMSQTTPDPDYDKDFPKIVRKYCRWYIYLRFLWSSK